jgi:RND family efflux transporter MFP subunit
MRWTAAAQPSRLLSPGLFVRLRLPIGQPRQAVLVSEKALGTDQGQRFVYVARKIAGSAPGQERYKVEYRRVTVGSTYDFEILKPKAANAAAEAAVGPSFSNPIREYERLWEVTSGLKPGETIVLGELQRVRPDIEVRKPRSKSNTTGSGAKKAAGKLPEVVVSQPVEKKVTDYEEFSGQMEAVYSVLVRARVNGYLEKIYFTDGMTVKKGDLLFLIDPRPYKTELDRARSLVAQTKAPYESAEPRYQRSARLMREGIIAAEEYIKDRSDYLQAKAAHEAALASEKSAELNMTFTRVTSPIDGKISRKFVDEGNLVKADDTLLTSIVSENPIQAYFDIDERTVLRLRRLLLENKIPSARAKKVAVYLAANDEETFRHEGRIDFIDNKIDPTAGTLKVRGTFKNVDNLFLPGMFARLKLPIGGEHTPVLVAERALWTDQGKKYLWVVDDVKLKAVKNRKTGQMEQVVDTGVVKSLEVKIGMLHDGLREIQAEFRTTEMTPEGKVIEVNKWVDGNSEKEKGKDWNGEWKKRWIVVSGLQRITRSDLDVRLKSLPMTTFEHAEAPGLPPARTNILGQPAPTTPAQRNSGAQKARK